MFVPGRRFCLACQMFASKAGAYLRVDYLKGATLG